MDYMILKEASAKWGVTVSYTHLDVYKRQGKNLPVCNGKYVRFVHVADSGKQAEVYFTDHDQ